MARAALAPGERVLDVACGTGLIAFAAAETIGPEGRVVGIDLSERMVDAARQRAEERTYRTPRSRAWMPRRWTCPMATSTLPCAPSVSCTCPIPKRRCARCIASCVQAVVSVSPSGANSIACGWSTLLSIVEARSRERSVSAVLPLGTAGHAGARLRRCGIRVDRTAARRGDIDLPRRRRSVPRSVRRRPRRACLVALRRRRAQARVRRRYIQAIEPWRRGRGYRIPGRIRVGDGRGPRPRSTKTAPKGGSRAICVASGLAPGPTP